jgi:hypothetical protein
MNCITSSSHMPLNPSQVLGSKDVCKKYCIKRLIIRDQDTQRKTDLERKDLERNSLRK